MTSVVTQNASLHDVPGLHCMRFLLGVFVTGAAAIDIHTCNVG